MPSTQKTRYDNIIASYPGTRPGALAIMTTLIGFLTAIAMCFVHFGVDDPPKTMVAMVFIFGVFIWFILWLLMTSVTSHFDLDEDVVRSNIRRYCDSQVTGVDVFVPHLVRPQPRVYEVGDDDGTRRELYGPVEVWVDNKNYVAYFDSETFEPMLVERKLALVVDPK